MYKQLEPPTDRNLEIYQDVAAGMSQRQAAQKYSLSQPMISKIVKQHKLWVVAAAPDPEFSYDQADFLALDALCETLAWSKERAHEAYEESCQPRQAPSEEGRPGRWYPAKPDMRCLKQMNECAEKFVVASKARESSRQILLSIRERDPHFKAWQSRLEKTERRRQMAGNLQDDIGRREHRVVSLAEALEILARPDLVCQLTSELEGVPPVPPDVRRLSEPEAPEAPASVPSPPAASARTSSPSAASARTQPTNGVNAALPKRGPTVIKPGDDLNKILETTSWIQLSPPDDQNDSNGQPAATNATPIPDAARLAALRRHRPDPRRSA